MNTPPGGMDRPPRRRRRTVSLLTVAVGYGAIGVALWLQPSRWHNTPSYANLLSILSTEVWGGIYLAVSAVMLAAVWQVRSRVLVVTAHTVAIALTGSWLLGFLVRYFTDSGTTIVNVVSWSTFLIFLIRSAVIIDDDRDLDRVIVEESAG